jgi:glycosyltransferase involved in cell wall biosynthesis
VNIAHLLAYSAIYPRTTHHGRYDWVMRLATLQAKAGHTVTLYCGPSSRSPHPNISFRSLPAPLRDRHHSNSGLFLLAFADDAHDIYHSHFDSLHYELAAGTAKPIVYTQHWFPNQTIAETAHRYPGANVLAVPVTSNMLAANQRLDIPSGPVISHGIDLSQFAPNYEVHGARLLCVGRITAQKGVAEAVQLVRSVAGLGLDIVGKILPADKDYWQSLQPYVDGTRIRYLGQLSPDEVARQMSEASGLLFLPQAPEAFGQTVIESQACGTPVISNQLGGENQLFIPGQTGFVVNSDDDFRQALQNLARLDPTTCRAFAEKFSLQTMSESYYDLYANLTSAYLNG